LLLLPSLFANVRFSLQPFGFDFGQQLRRCGSQISVNLGQDRSRLAVFLLDVDVWQSSPALSRTRPKAQELPAMPAPYTA
jgi:hypothetical protein